MSIEFKNVNQGDSILISWDFDGVTKFGIIDCHAENLNPILNAIKLVSPKEIDFIVVSHPHEDHFSGFIELFKFLSSSKINVKWLGITFDGTICPTYQKFYSTKKKKSLFEFFELLCDSSHFIEEVSRIDHNTKDLILTPDIKLIFRSPHLSELMSLSKRFAKHLSGLIKGPPDLNIYSTIIELKAKDDSVLFTSDAPKIYFEKLKKYFDREGSPNFKLVQIPHHGSAHNYVDDFWRTISRVSACPIIFSVGDEPSDMLPDRSVVESIDHHGYDIFSTNPVYGIADHFKLGRPKTPPAILSLVSTPRGYRPIPSPSKFSGDKLFKL